MASSDRYDGPALFHVGYPKTATTYLQSAVFSDAGFGFGLAAGPKNRSHIFEWFRTGDPYAFDPVAVRSEMAGLEEQVRAAGCVPVWSEETLLGNPLTRHYDGAWALERLRAVEAPFKILITIRKQTDMALSAYREYLKLHRHGLGDFIGTGHEPRSFTPILRPDYLCFDIAADRWAAAFGVANLLVLPQELLRKDPDAYVRQIAVFAGLPAVPAASVQQHNVGLGGTALAASRWLNALFVRSPLSARKSVPERGVRKLLVTLDRLSPRGLDQIVERRWKAQIEQRYRGVFDESNRRLVERTGLDLAGLGYPVAKDDTA